MLVHVSTCAGETVLDFNIPHFILLLILFRAPFVFAVITKNDKRTSSFFNMNFGL